MALVERSDENGIVTLTLNRPDALNALSTDVFNELRAHIDAIAASETVAAVVLRGAGRSFCAGADLKAIQRERAAGTKPTTFKRDTVTALENLPQPVIAAVHGHCFAGGLELALAADLIVAAEGTRFADTHAKWGLFAGWGMSARLPRRIGIPAAKRMMYSAKEINAAEALRIGLADVVVPDDKLVEESTALAQSIASNSAASLRWLKQVMAENATMTLSEAVEYERTSNTGMTGDAMARIAKF
jgi:enoyl-CoA hydratase/carnithine racemase